MATHSTAQHSIEHQIQDIQPTNMAYFGSRVIESVLHTLMVCTVHSMYTPFTTHTQAHISPKEGNNILNILMYYYGANINSTIFSYFMLRFSFSFVEFSSFFSVSFRSVRFDLVWFLFRPLYIYTYSPSSFFLVPGSTIHSQLSPHSFLFLLVVFIHFLVCIYVKFIS